MARKASDPAVLVDDDAVAGVGQMLRSAFLPRLRQVVTRAANEELRLIGRTADDCPYIAFWLEHYAHVPAEHLEQALRRYARPAGTSVDAYLAAVERATRVAVVRWRQVPSSVEQAALGDPSMLPEPIRVLSGLGPGVELPAGIRTTAERSMGGSFENVRLHTDAAGRAAAVAADAQAITIGRDVALAREPSGIRGPATDMLILHELAHARQQEGAVEVASVDHEASDESQAHGVATAAGAAPARVSATSGLALRRCSSKKGPGDAGITYTQPTLDLLAALRAATTPDAVLTALARPGGDLGELTPPDRTALMDRLRPIVTTHLSSNPQDGPRLITAFEDANGRAGRGNVPRDLELAVLATFTPAAGRTGFTLANPDPAARQFPVQAFLFPGRDPSKRALVVGGIHGSEPQGRRVAEGLMAILRARTTPQLYTAIVVPVLFTGTDTAHERYVKVGVSGGRVDVTSRSQGSVPSATVREVEPNRNFPQPGETSDDLRRRVAGGGPELVAGPGSSAALAGDRVISTMLPENRALVQLIEQFRPQRLATLHAHSTRLTRPASGATDQRGDDPGVFVDPRGGIDPATGRASTAEGQADDALARRLLDDARRRSTAARIAGPTNAFAGNEATTWPQGITRPYSATGDNVHYESLNTPVGSSLGTWAPSRGVTTITVEVPQWPRSSATALAGQIQVYAEVLDAEFLDRA